jgi:hypothetical protein
VRSSPPACPGRRHWQTLARADHAPEQTAAAHGDKITPSSNRVLLARVSHLNRASGLVACTWQQRMAIAALAYMIWYRKGREVVLESISAMQYCS